MFTGIVEEMGAVAWIAPSPRRLTLSAHTTLADLRIGDSIAVNGVCLTAVGVNAATFCVDVSDATLRLTNLGDLAVGDPVNLERAMTLASRIGGHLVSGHVEGVGTLRARGGVGEDVVWTLDVPPHILRYCICAGSIAVEGVSLTINTRTEEGITLTLIPHTLAVTTLGRKAAGDRVNLESDLIGKYVEQLLPQGAQFQTR